MNIRSEINRIVSHLPIDVANSIKSLDASRLLKLQEIRLHSDSQVLLNFGVNTLILDNNGQVSKVPTKNSLTVTANEISQTLKSLCEYSVHSFNDELVNGFITIEGGHRIGVFGLVVMESGKIISLQNISSLNIRIAREVWGAAEDFYTKVFTNSLKSVLIAGAPSTGKTTILRDLIRGISNGRLGRLYKVSVCDERGEIAAMHDAVPQNSMGLCTDVYSLCPKAQAMQMALRAGSPELIACDEIGSSDDVQMLMQSMLSGVHVIATTHANSMEQLRRQKNIAYLIDNGVFEKIVILENNGQPSVIGACFDV